MPGQVKLRLCFNNRSQVALSIPLAECQTFANHPLRWLRFLGFAIYGQRGYLSMSENGPELDYTAQIQACSYYFTPDGDTRFVDADALDNRTSIASQITIKRANFRDNLVERDGTCVVSGELAHHCHACHVLPHSKGSSYISNLFNHRGGLYDHVDPFDDVNDPRNGILLYRGLHPSFDTGEIAFLRTPNFALTVDDIPYHLERPSAGSPTSRLTLQHIQPAGIGPVLSHFGPHNSDVRQPQDMTHWPPAIILDFSYASIVLRAWGPKPFFNYIRAISKDSYCTHAGGNASAGPSRPTAPTARALRYAKRRAKKARAAGPADRPTMGDAMDAVMTLWTRTAREATVKRRQADDAERAQKIRTWLQTTEDANS